MMPFFHPVSLPRAVILLTGLVLIIVAVWFVNNESPASQDLSEYRGMSAEEAFARFGLRTDTSKASIPLEKVLSGGPGKDGIPALTNPAFVSIDDATVGDETLGILVEHEREKRFYPYTILIWHEIVNDTIDDLHFAVTFCPLCGSAVVFDRRVKGEILTFGVSGLLYESNLLMYDRTTESLWSQAGTGAVVGEMTGTKLSLVEMKHLTFAQLKKSHPDARVLSTETGYDREYDVDPYAGYGLTDNLYFPVTVSNVQHPPKTIMYVIRVEEESVAFPEAELQSESTFTHGETKLVAQRVSDGIEVFADGTRIPGYYEMWFSFATQHEKDGVVWNIN